MKKLLFALYDTEGYMKSLAEYLGKKNFLLESRLFTKMDSLTDFLREHHPDVLLLGQEIDQQQLQFLDHAESVIVLTEGNIVAERVSPFPLVFKYQSAEKVLQEIFQIIAETGDTVPASLRSFGGHTEFLGICRLYGEPLPLQRIFSVKGGREKKSLFINMELLSGLECGKQGTEQLRGMSEIIFYLKQKSDKLSAKVRALAKEWEGSDYLYPVEDYRDLYSISRDDVDRLLLMLADETDYERVVFDVGFLNDTALYLLYCCDRIYIPRAKNNWEENQRNALERLLTREGLEDMVESIRYVSA